MVTMFFSSSTLVWMKEFEILMTATSLLSCASIRTVNTTASVATVGEPAYFFEMKSRCLFPPATVRPLTFPSLLCLRNIWDFNTSDLSFSVRLEQCLGSNVFLKCNCFISAWMTLFAFYPHWFKPSLSDSCVMIAATALTGCAMASLNSKCASGCSTSCCSICEMT